MVIMADVEINSTYLFLGSIAYAGGIGLPIFRSVRSKLRDRKDADDFKDRVDGTLWGRKPSRYEPHPPEGLVDRQEASAIQQEATARAVTQLTNVVGQLAERFEAHIDHPPGHKS